ncbi:sulfotransferase family protein [Nonomuraea sp. MG754425]|uniref:sulfotransferase family protein n=1 Tax=Nonomuraea sp. MG754425 TaxID=2570319 RepID=UPI001F3C60F4|nr:sulfotransferase family protein [Nonomuraea sp. MG754425]
MLTVIGAGFPRTGTSSMKAALERLGFGPCFHMFSILSEPRRAGDWLPLADSDEADWERLFDGFRSTQDWPASYFWRELAGAYPEAKVVLTVRDPRAWYASMLTLINNGPRAMLPAGGGADLPPAARAVFEGMSGLRPVIDRMAAGTFGPGRTMTDGPVNEEAAVAAFERHTAAVQAALPPERLLVFDVREGWEPLCRFLGADVPGEPFPHLNDGRSMREFLGRLMNGEVSHPSFPGGA